MEKHLCPKCGKQMERKVFMGGSPPIWRCKPCEYKRSDPTHIPQPEQEQKSGKLTFFKLEPGPVLQPASEPERIVCDNGHHYSGKHPCPLCNDLSEPKRMSDGEEHWTLMTSEEREERWPKVIRELRTLRTQLAEKEQYAVNAKAALEAEFANHIKTRTQLAEKDATLNALKDGRVVYSNILRGDISLSKEDAAAYCGKDAAIEKARRDALEEAAKECEKPAAGLVYNRPPTWSECARAIRALAAQKKEG